MKQDRFRSQFGLEMLHLWIVKLNLVQHDRAEGAKMFAEVCEQVWARAEPRLYDAGIHSFMLSKYACRICLSMYMDAGVCVCVYTVLKYICCVARNMKDLQQWTFGSMTAYDQAIITLQNTDEERVVYVCVTCDSTCVSACEYCVQNESFELGIRKN